MPLPTVPPFDKTRLPQGPWVPAFSALWTVLQPFFKHTVETLRPGVLVARPLEVEIMPSQSYPTREYTSPLPSGVSVGDVIVSNVVDPSNPSKAPALTGGVTVSWTHGPNGGVVVLAVTGLPANTRLVVRVLVFSAYSAY